jgi:protein gp37
MGADTKIEWCDHTFNPWIGCTRLSPACDFCYAETLAHRYGWAEWGAGKPRHRTSESTWRQPLAWNRAAQAAGVRRRVFCASLADVFDAEVDAGWRMDLFSNLINVTPWLDWLLLTKRPKVANEFFGGFPVQDNIWIGTTVENQKMADLRIPELLQIKAKVRFLSCEPLLGPLDLTAVCTGHYFIDSLSGHKYHDSPEPSPTEKCARINWVIAGGESGGKARPSHPDWFRSLRRQCLWSSERLDTATPFFFKQWGDWAPAKVVPGGDLGGDFRRGNAQIVKPVGENDGHFRKGDALMARVGKGAAGATLDGREHREFPT